MDPNNIAWIPLGAGVTVIGVLLSWVAWRRRGAAAGLRGVAWSLLPLAAVLTGVTTMLWQAGTAVTRWVTGFVFKPTVWAGVAVAVLAVVLYFVSGLMRRRGGAGRTGGAQAGKAAVAGAAAGDTKGAKDDKTSKTGKASRGPDGGPREVEQRRPDADPDLAEIDEILKRRGIS
jgi:hypothetical protein